MVVNKPERKSITVEMPFPLNMHDDAISDYCDVAARKMADTMRREIMEKIGPNWFDTPSGFVHAPGVYRCRVDFTITNELTNLF